MGLPKVVWQLGVRHQVEPEELHGMTSRGGLATGEYAAATGWSVNPRAFAGAMVWRSGCRGVVAARSGPVAIHPHPAAGRLLHPSARDPGRVSWRRCHILAGLPRPVATTEDPTAGLPDHRAHARR